jgi:hypothetical protein
MRLATGMLAGLCGLLVGCASTAHNPDRQDILRSSRIDSIVHYEAAENSNINLSAEDGRVMLNGWYMEEVADSQFERREVSNEIEPELYLELWDRLAGIRPSDTSVSPNAPEDTQGIIILRTALGDDIKELQCFQRFNSEIYSPDPVIPCDVVREVSSAISELAVRG